MTPEEYENRNLKGFESDDYMKAKFEEIIELHKVDIVIECGTYKGGTTKKLSKMCNEVIGIEINDVFFNITRSNVGYLENVTLYNESTLYAFPRIFAQKEIQKSKLFIFIDSHWQDLPILKELALIKNFGLKPIIAIHDFKVPNHPELGYDSYGGKTLEWELIEAHIQDIYGVDGFTYEYNSKSNGAMRGVCYIYPKN